MLFQLILLQETDSEESNTETSGDKSRSEVPELMPKKSESVHNPAQQKQSLTVPMQSALHSSIRRQTTMAGKESASMKKTSLLDKKQKDAIRKRMSGVEKEESPRKVNPAGTS